jgi:hypothetical protein
MERELMSKELPLEFVLSNGIKCEIINPEWIKRLIEILEKDHDYDTPKDQGSAKTTPKS